MKMFHEFVRAEKEKSKRIMYIASSRILKWAAFLLNKERKELCSEEIHVHC